ncbi:histidine ammonia-lyase [Candidatus Bipolaricaulota bacterium]|nr:histidine ammonia-lyase [Candidatus Bipolaricaulota bacterium]
MKPHASSADDASGHACRSMIANRPRHGSAVGVSAPIELCPGQPLTIHDVVAVARGNAQGNYAEVSLCGDWADRCRASHAHIAAAVREARDTLSSLPKDASEEAIVAAIKERTGVDVASKLPLFIYGVTTGFGANRDRLLFDPDSVSRMQVNILRSHAAGAGNPAPIEVVRAMLLLRARAFVEGYSGVRPEIVRLLVDMLNRQVHPVVPEQGSVGASGDLCPLAHLGLVLIGEGEAWIGTPSPGQCPADGGQALTAAGLAPLDHLEAKEGLALTNGTNLSTAFAVFAAYDADMLLGTANLSGAMSLQAMRGFTRALDPRVHQARSNKPQMDAAAQVTSLLQGSSLVNTAHDVQDSYSLRCIPQVHGAALRAIDHVWEILSDEINAVTDNPLFFVDDGTPAFPEDPTVCLWNAYAAGNFHAEPVALACDYLKLAVAELGSISERRSQLLLDPHHNRGLRAHLSAGEPGLHSGLMLAQYTAAALVSENKVLAHPACVDSIPTSSNSEDHVSMAPIAARHARQMIGNVQTVIAIELLCALQALDLRTNRDTSALSASAAAVHALVRDAGIPFIAEDRTLSDLIGAMRRLVSDGSVLRKAIRALPE